jgi:zinc/manganese transport system substrate-binding protein
MKIRRFRFASFSFVLLASLNSQAKIKVVTTLPSFASIASRVGGDDVDVTSLTKGTQDPHFVDAKPNLILSLNKASLVIRAGLGLEDGWLPPLVTGSRNSNIANGSDGDFEVASIMHLKEVPVGKVDRTQGDVHPGGNPHFMLDPRNGVLFAQVVADRLSKLDPAKAIAYHQRAKDYMMELSKKISDWEKALAPLKGKPVVTYHKSWIYFSDWTGLVEAGFIEPKPGIPPSPDHIVKLVALMKLKNVGLIIMEPYYPHGVGDEVARQSGAKLLVLPTEVQGAQGADDYIKLFDTIVTSLPMGLAK